MIDHARRLEQADPLGVEYLEADAAELSERFDPESFEMVTSCLALQDMPEVEHVLTAIGQVIRPGGRFVASISHPCTNTPFRRWERDPQGKKRWLCIDRYFDRGVIEYRWQRWSYDFTTRAIHAPLEEWIAWLVAAGFTLRGLKEPRPTAEALATRPELSDAARVPYYLVLDLVRDRA